MANFVGVHRQRVTTHGAPRWPLRWLPNRLWPGRGHAPGTRPGSAAAGERLVLRDGIGGADTAGPAQLRPADGGRLRPAERPIPPDAVPVGEGQAVRGGASLLDRRRSLRSRGPRRAGSPSRARRRRRPVRPRHRRPAVRRDRRHHRRRLAGPGLATDCSPGCPSAPAPRGSAGSPHLSWKTMRRWPAYCASCAPAALAAAAAPWTTRSRWHSPRPWGPGMPAQANSGDGQPVEKRGPESVRLLVLRR